MSLAHTRTRESLVWCVAFVVVLAAQTHSVSAYKHGDVVTMQKRSQYRQMRTEWTDVSVRHAPLFAKGVRVQLPAPRLELEEAASGSGGEPFKMMFRFAGERFSTHWITIDDGADQVARMIVITFEYAGGELRAVSHGVSYGLRNATFDGAWGTPTEKPDSGHVFLYYQWVEFKEYDAHGGVSFLFLTGFVASAVVVVNLFVTSSSPGGASSSSGVRVRRDKDVLYSAVPQDAPPSASASAVSSGTSTAFVRARPPPPSTLPPPASGAARHGSTMDASDLLA